MRILSLVCSAIIALGLAIVAVAAEQILKPIHAYRLGSDDQAAILYYVAEGNGYDVVTTWVGAEDVPMRHIAHLEPGQHYALSLIERGLPVQFTVRNDDGQVVMGEAESLFQARGCGGDIYAYPSPVQRLVLCHRDPVIAEHPASSSGTTSTRLGMGD